MSHALSGLGAEAGHDHLVVAPDRAIEEQERGAGKPRFQLVGDMGAGGDEVEMPARGLVADAKAERVAGAVIAAGMRLALEIPGALAGHGEGLDLDAAGRAVGQGGFERPVDLDRHARDVLLAQHVEDAVRLQDRQHLGVGIDRKGRTLAHRQQSRDRVDLAIGQDHARDRRMAQRAWPGDEAAACAISCWRRSGEALTRNQCSPSALKAIDACVLCKFGMFVSRGPANLAAAIPLRYAAARRSAKDDDAKHDPSPGKPVTRNSETETQ